MITREANKEDWMALQIFFKKIYRKGHPLHNYEFWLWQFGDKTQGRSFICLNDSNEIVGHVGANFKGNLAWIINVYLDEECRGKGILGKLYALAREYYPLAATAANEAGLGLYRNMRWYRYHDLIRMIKINPIIENPKFQNVCCKTNVEFEKYLNNDSFYFKQPGLKGLLLDDNTSKGISQEDVGGFRVTDFENLNSLEKEVWKLGYNWMDYITSWNDMKIKNLENNGWVIDYKSFIPWRLNPIEENYFCDITFLSEEPLNKDLVVHRSFSDHGRVGSLK